MKQFLITFAAVTSGIVIAGILLFTFSSWHQRRANENVFNQTMEESRQAIEKMNRQGQLLRQQAEAVRREDDARSKVMTVRSSR